jgi:hypothetical protein
MQAAAKDSRITGSSCVTRVQCVKIAASTAVPSHAQVHQQQAAAMSTAAVNWAPKCCPINALPGRNSTIQSSDTQQSSPQLHNTTHRTYGTIWAADSDAHNFSLCKDAG